MAATMQPEIRDLGHCPECAMEWKYFVPCNKSDCPGIGYHCHDPEWCKGTWEGATVPRGHSAHCCKDGQRGPFLHLVGVEYDYTSPERYDGVSEWMCPGCFTRWGRWTNKKLEEGELESRFGQPRERQRAGS